MKRALTILLVLAVLLPACLLPFYTPVSPALASTIATRAQGTNFAGLSSLPNGSLRYCSDCAKTNPCTGSGTGALATREGGAWNCGASGSGMSNPMTTAGDIIKGGASGTPQRLAVGSNGDVLTVVSGAPAWAAPSGGGGYAGVTTGGTGSLDFAQGTKTSNEPFLDGTVTWNASGTTFSAFTFNVTNTASAAASTLMDLKVGGSSMFRVDKGGTVGVGGHNISFYSLNDTDTGVRLGGVDGEIWLHTNGTVRHKFTETGYQMLGAGDISVPNDCTEHYRWSGRTRLQGCINGKLQIFSGATSKGTIAFGSENGTSITANVDNYAPCCSNENNGYFQRWTSTGAFDVTGYAGDGNIQPGEVRLIVNVGSNNITLKHESASSTAANRFLNSTGADIVLSANQAADMIYDSTSQRWRVFRRN